MNDIHRLIERHGLEKARGMAETATDRLAVEAAAAMLGDEAMRYGVAHAGFAMTALPHKRIEARVWSREAGPVKLLVESGLERDETLVGVPYGSIARMILLYLQTQAVKTQDREVKLGASMNAWLGNMGIAIGGKTYLIVREQSRRISRCRLTFFQRLDRADVVENGAFVSNAILPVNPDDDQLPLWQDKVRLDDGFYRSLIDHPLPLREEAIRQISGRSMAIDVYVWLAYRLHILEKPLPVSWAALNGQFGAGYARERDMKPVFLDAMKLALAVYPEAKVEPDNERGITLYPSKPPVVEKDRRLGQN